MLSSTTSANATALMWSSMVCECDVQMCQGMSVITSEPKLPARGPGVLLLTKWT